MHTHHNCKSAALLAMLAMLLPLSSLLGLSRFVCARILQLLVKTVHSGATVVEVAVRVDYYAWHTFSADFAVDQR